MLRLAGSGRSSSTAWPTARATSTERECQPEHRLQGLQVRPRNLFLTQRSNNTYRSLATAGDSKGKAMLAVHSAQDRLLVMVQQDGTSGIALNRVRDRLVALGFDHAVFLDGSDSACLWHQGSWVVMPGSNKNETNTIGLSFG